MFKKRSLLFFLIILGGSVFVMPRPVFAQELAEEIILLQHTMSQIACVQGILESTFALGIQQSGRPGSPLSLGLHTSGLKFGAIAVSTAGDCLLGAGVVHGKTLEYAACLLNAGIVVDNLREAHGGHMTDQGEQFIAVGTGLPVTLFDCLAASLPTK